MDGITLRSTHNAHEPPVHIKLVVELVRDLSNKYVPTPSLDEIEIDLLQSLKDFCHRARKQAAKVHLREKSSHVPPQNTSDISPPSSDTNTDSWQEPDCGATEDNDHFWGFDTDLYGKILSNPEVASQHKWFEGFLDKLELDLMNSITSLRKTIPETSQTRTFTFLIVYASLPPILSGHLFNQTKRDSGYQCVSKITSLTCKSTSNDTAMKFHAIISTQSIEIPWHSSQTLNANIPMGNTNSSNHGSRRGKSHCSASA